MIRSVIFAMGLGALFLAGCSPAGSNNVQLRGDTAYAAVVLATIRAAEGGDEAAFRQHIGRSADPAYEAPARVDVDRTDEDCEVRSIEGLGPMVSVVWSCRGNNTKPNVQRSFLVERGRVTYMWNDWAEVL